MIPNGTASADGWQQKPALSDVWSDRAGFFEVVRKGEGWKEITGCGRLDKRSFTE